MKVTKATVIIMCMVMPLGTAIAQGPVPIVPATLIDTSANNGVYRGAQSQVFLEPTTGNLVTSWYRFLGSTAANPRQITAATSTDGGATWTIHEGINFGVGTEMNARYPSVSGTSATPIIAYSDRNPPGVNQGSRPTVAFDLFGWGGNVFENVFVDNSNQADSALYGRYLSVSVAPDNENLWAVGAYHNDTPGEALYYYYSDDAGTNWNGPFIPASAVPADNAQTNYVIDLSSVGLGVTLGINNEVMVSGLGQWNSDSDIWRVLYSFSTDKGVTWSPLDTIPGTTFLDFANGDIYREVTQPILDGAGNWHIFALGTDTSAEGGTTFPEPYRTWDFRFDGTTWSINQFNTPQLLENGINAWGDYPSDIETYAMNEPAVGPDGTIYYAYSDVVDTAGSNGDESLFNYNIMVMVSEDNGDSWNGPVSVLDEWGGRAPNGMAVNANDKLHIVYRRHYEDDTPEELWYMGVPTDTIKALAGQIGVEPVNRNIPSKFALLQNYPNPFNPVTTIKYSLPKTGDIHISVYNLLGEEIVRLLNEVQKAGDHQITWDASNFASGIYFYRLQAGDYVQTRKMVLLK